MLRKRTFFTTLVLFVLFAFANYIYFDFNESNNSWIFGINLFSSAVSISIIQQTTVLKKNNLATFIFLILLFGFNSSLQTLPSAISFLLINICYILLFYFYFIRNVFFLIGIVFSCAMFIDYYIFPLIIAPIFLAFYRTKINKSLFYEFFLGIFITSITLLQVLYLMDETKIIQNYINSIQFRFPHFEIKHFWLIPIFLFSIYSFVDFLLNASKSTVSHKNTSRLYFVFLLFTMIPGFVFQKDFTFLFHFICLPLTIILSRLIQYLPKKWLQNIVILLIVFSVLGYKYHTFILNNL